MIILSNNTGKKSVSSVYPRYYGELATAPSGTIVANSGYADIAIMRLEQYIGGSWTQRYILAALPTSTPGATVGQPMGLLMGLTYAS